MASDFYSPHVGEVWSLVNGYGDVTTIAQETAEGFDGVSGIVWHYRKSTCRAYWNPGDCTAELWLGLKMNADGSWSSTHQEIACSICLPNGHTQATVDNLLEPGGYRIIPAGDGSTGDTGYHPCWHFDVLTAASSVCVSDLIPWRTDAYFENGLLVSEQWENCPAACSHEKWYFGKGIGVVKITPLESAGLASDPLAALQRSP